MDKICVFWVKFIQKISFLRKRSKKVLTKKIKNLKYTSFAEHSENKKFFKNESRQSVWALAEFMS